MELTFTFYSVNARPDGYFMDKDFEKGHIPLDGATGYGDNVVERLTKDLNDTAADYDAVYQQLAVTGKSQSV